MSPFTMLIDHIPSFSSHESHDKDNDNNSLSTSQWAGGGAVLAATTAAGSTTSASLYCSTSAKDEAALMEHLAQTRESFSSSLRELRRERESWRADKLELEHLKSLLNQYRHRQQDDDEDEADSSNLIGIINGPGAVVKSGDSVDGQSNRKQGKEFDNSMILESSRAGFDAHARHEEQLEVYAEQICALKELVHSLQQENKNLRVEIDTLKSSKSSSGLVQQMEEQVNKWEALYFESAEMGASKIEALEMEIEELKASIDHGSFKSDEANQNETNQQREGEATVDDGVGADESLSSTQQGPSHTPPSTAGLMGSLVAIENSSTGRSTNNAKQQQQQHQQQSENESNREYLCESRSLLGDRLDELTAQLIESEGKLSEQTMISQQLQAKLDESEVARRQLEDRLGRESCAGQESAQELQARLEDLAASKHDANEQAQKQIDALEESLEVLKERFGYIENENTQLRTVRDSLKGMDKEITGVIEALEVQLPEAQAEYDRLKEQLSHRERELEQAMDDLHDRSQREGLLLKELRKQSQLLELTENDLLETESRLHDVQEEFREARSSLEALETLKEEVHALREKNEEYTVYSEILHDKNKSLQLEVMALKAAQEGQKYTLFEGGRSGALDPSPPLYRYSHSQDISNSSPCLHYEPANFEFSGSSSLTQLELSETYQIKHFPGMRKRPPLSDVVSASKNCEEKECSHPTSNLQKKQTRNVRAASYNAPSSSLLTTTATKRNSTRMSRIPTLNSSVHKQ